MDKLPHEQYPGRAPVPPAPTYWRQVCLWTLLGLALWFGVTFGVSWWAHALDAWHVGHMPAGYWWATQGAIGLYLLIIVGHGWLMDRLERRVLGEGGRGDRGHG
jgi:putative solute:sodium symporter small subunit